MWKKMIKKEVGFGGPKNVSRKVLQLEDMSEQLLEMSSIIGHGNFQEGFGRDATEDMDEAVKLLEKAAELISGFSMPVSLESD